MYDASLGRWFNLDPLTEKYATKSPFHFSGNNPMKFVDLNGMSYKYNWDDGRYYNDEGIETSWDEVLAWIQRPENQGIIYGNEEYYASWGSYPHRSNSMTAFAFGRSWKKGEGGYYYLYPGDYFADQLLIHSSVLAAYEDVIKQIALGETTGRYSYSVGGMKTLKYCL